MSAPQFQVHGPLARKLLLTLLAAACCTDPGRSGPDPADSTPGGAVAPPAWKTLPEATAPPSSAAPGNAAPTPPEPPATPERTGRSERSERSERSGANVGPGSPPLSLSLPCSGLAGTTGPGIKKSPVDYDFSGGPLYFTGSFDGSQRFGLWAETLRFARSLGHLYGKRPRFTYFINACYYSTSVSGSAIGKAESAEEVLVRRALTQEAINQGHEIANHTVRHLDGTTWSAKRWREELLEFHAIMDVSLFHPIRTSEGNPVFPRFQPVPGAPSGALGSACASNADCASQQCLALTETQSFCTQPCNKNLPCPAGTACGAPSFMNETDACIPLPQYPIEHNGVELFDAEGRPNLAHPDLRSYRTAGFRAPFLGHNDALIKVLLELGYIYDASFVLDPDPPLCLGEAGGERALLEHPLMRYPGSLALPMDYNYFVNKGSGERMESDYRRSLVLAYSRDDRPPWNAANHFALFNNGAYQNAFKNVFDFAARGCPGENGEVLCPSIDFPSFLELSTIIATPSARPTTKPPRRPIARALRRPSARSVDFNSPH